MIISILKIEAFKTLPTDAIVHLPPPQWTRPMQPNIIKMSPYYFALGTQQWVHPSIEVSATQARCNLQKFKDKRVNKATPLGI